MASACIAPESAGIRSSFDMGWGGLSHAELLSSVAGDAYNRQQRATSLQLERDDSASLELLQLQQLQQALLQQQQQLQQAAAAQQQSQAEDGIDVQIQHLLELKAQLRRNKQAAAHQQQQQVILEDMALGSDASNCAGLDAAAASALFASSGLVTPIQSESLLMGPELSGNSWGNLAAARAAAQPSRRSVDLGGLAQQLAALEMSNNAAAVALAESQGLVTGMRPFSGGLNNNHSRLSLDCGGPMGLAPLSNDDLLAAASMAAAQAEAASRRTSLCLGGPQVSGLLDSMLPDPRQSLDVVAAAGASLALQSSLYAPAGPALDTQMPVSNCGMAGLASMPSPAAMGVQRSPARHSLDCSMLGGGPSLSPAVLGHMPGVPSPAPSPVPCGRTSLHLPQPPLLGDRGLAMAQAAAQAHNDAAGWSFAARRCAGGRASLDVRRQSSELAPGHSQGMRVPPRKSISMIAPGCSGNSSGSGTNGGGSSSAGSSGRSSPRNNNNASANKNQGARRASMDRPPIQPPKRSPSSAALATTPDGVPAPATSAATVSTAEAPARKGTGVFIPSCMFKS